LIHHVTTTAIAPLSKFVILSEVKPTIKFIIVIVVLSDLIWWLSTPQVTMHFIKRIIIITVSYPITVDAACALH
jgi:hypothetical protein